MRALLALIIAGGLATATSAQQPSTYAAAGGGSASTSTAVAADEVALREMLRGPRGREARWTQRPHLIVITSVLVYRKGRPETYPATATAIPRDELVELASHLEDALAPLTGRRFRTFGSVTFEPASPGKRVRVARDGHIVVARFEGLREALQAVGYGGRTARADGTITSGTVMLDSVYDSSDPLRRLLRAHELGHALGYNHVAGRQSIMNPTLGSEITDFDRRAARAAFARP